MHNRMELINMSETVQPSVPANTLASKLCAKVSRKIYTSLLVAENCRIEMCIANTITVTHPHENIRLLSCCGHVITHNNTNIRVD